MHEIVLRMISQKDCHSLGETEDTLEDSFRQRVSLDIENLQQRVTELQGMNELIIGTQQGQKAVLSSLERKVNTLELSIEERCEETKREI